MVSSDTPPVYLLPFEGSEAVRDLLWLWPCGDFALPFAHNMLPAMRNNIPSENIISKKYGIARQKMRKISKIYEKYGGAEEWAICRKQRKQMIKTQIIEK